VATIQTDQYRLITREPDRPLVIQGGPGTGKTAVGLHRASWLLYTFRDRLGRAGVLVVGPNPTFMEYVSHVLPALGEAAVEPRASVFGCRSCAPSARTTGRSSGAPRSGASRRSSARCAATGT